jgi:hypothetical protein
MISIAATRFAALALLAGSLLASHRAAAGEIYRCSVDGKIVLTDVACKVNAPPVESPRLAVTEPGTRLSQGAHRFTGKWFGALQFEASLAGVAVANARSQVQFAFSVDDDGSVRASAPDSGCQFRGTASFDDLLDAEVLELSASACKVAEFNQRYRGQMLLPADGAVATVTLSVTRYLGQPARPAINELRANLHR